MSRVLYDVLVALHVLCAIVGFASLAISGVYGFSSRDLKGAGAMEEAKRYFRSPGRLELAVVLVPVFGVAALAIQPGGRGVTQAWSSAALAVWVVAVAVLLRVVRPSEKAIRRGLDAGDHEAIATAAARLGWATIATDLAFAAALGLMIFQPH